MDSLPPLLRNSSAFRDMPPATIALHGPGLRRTEPGVDQQAGLVASIRALGVLQPLIVRSHPSDPALRRIVAGRRRLAATIEIGLDAVPVDDRGEISDAEATAIEMAENVARTALAPLDQWRAMNQLRQLGWTDIAAIADALGIAERLARRLDKLGRMHPDVLAAIEQHGMPDDVELAHIAAAPQDVQASAIKKLKGDNWWPVAAACNDTAIPLSRAIFDPATAGVPFEEDLFAEPGSDEQFTTHDVAGFLAAQKAALEARVAKSKGKQVLATCNPKSGEVALPKGWQQVWWDGRGKLPSGAVKIVAVKPSGYRLGEVVEIAAKPPGAAPTAPTRDAPEADDEDTTDEDADEPETPRTPAAPAPKPRLTHAGRELLAELRTDALRAALRDRPATPETTLAVLLLSLAANNVVVSGERGSRYSRTSFDDIAAAVFVALDQAEHEQGPRLDRLATEAAARILVCAGVKAGNGSGDAAEWVGALIGAGAALPRLDREDLLGAMSRELLEEIAAAQQVKPGKVAEMRRHLAGNAPRMTLPEARFHAAPPELEDQPACQRNAGAKACRCGWKESDGEDAADCALGTWRTRMARLGIGTPRLPRAPADPAEQRRQDAAAFDGAPEGAFDCGWTGAAMCREDGTTRCLRQCPRHEKYTTWLGTQAGRAAKRAQENADARASLKRAGKKKGAEA